MYKKQKDIKANHTVIIILIIALTVMTVIALSKPHITADRIENIVQLEYHRNYTVERYNGAIDALYLDQKVYNYTDCDYIDHNDESHNCVITDTIKLWEELTLLGYN